MPDPELKHKLLIKPLIKNIQWWKFFRCCPIQNRRFSYGVEIENIDTSPFPGGTITQIHIKSGERKDLTHVEEEQFRIPPLNPHGKYKIIFGNIYTYLSGIAWLKCHIEASDKGVIEFFQFDIADEKASRLSKIEPGWWEDVIFVSSQFEHQQIWTNKLLVLLTAITLAQGLWGLREFIKFIWGSLIGILYSLWYSIISIAQFLSNIKHP